MSNFEGSQSGLITRISSNLKPPAASIYGCVLPAAASSHGSMSGGEGLVGEGGGGGAGAARRGGGVRIDAVEVKFDYVTFEKRFLEMWPKGSPAFESYFRRIQHGPSGYTIAHANRLHVL